MKADILSSFISFELSPEEELAAFTFNDCQIAGIQNYLASQAEDLLKVTLEVDELSLDDIKKRAYTKGCINTAKYFLSMADTIKCQREEAERDGNNNSQ